MQENDNYMLIIIPESQIFKENTKIYMTKVPFDLLSTNMGIFVLNERNLTLGTTLFTLH